RDGGDFKAECDDDEDATEKSGVVLKAGPGKYGRNFLQIRFAGCAKDPGDPVNEKTRREGTEHQIFDGGFQRGWITPGKTNQHIKGNRNQLQRNENQDEIDGGSHPHQAGAGEKWDREKFAETGLRCRALNADRDRGRKIEHHHQHAGGGGKGDSFKEKRERISGVEVPQRSRRSGRLRRDKERRDENHRQAKQGGIAEKTAVELGSERFDQEDNGTEDNYRNFEIRR